MDQKTIGAPTNRETNKAEAPRGAIDRLFSNGDVYIFRHKLTPNAGYASNGAIHDLPVIEVPATGSTSLVLLETRCPGRVVCQRDSNAWAAFRRGTTVGPEQQPQDKGAANEKLPI